MPVLSDILEAIRESIQGLELPGIAAANVVVHKVPTDRAQDLPAAKIPAIVIAPFGPETLDPQAGTNLRDDVGYPVLVAILADDAADQHERFPQFLGWREAIRRKFHNQRLGPALCFTVRVEPQAVVDRGAWRERRLFLSSLILRCFSRESRG